MDFQKEVVESHKAIWNELYQLRKIFSSGKVNRNLSLLNLPLFLQLYLLLLKSDLKLMTLNLFLPILKSLNKELPVPLPKLLENPDPSPSPLLIPLADLALLPLKRKNLLKSNPLLSLPTLTAMPKKKNLKAPQMLIKFLSEDLLARKKNLNLLSKSPLTLTKTTLHTTPSLLDTPLIPLPLILP